MRYMVMHYQTQAMEDGVRPSPEEQAAIGQYMQEAAMSGVLLTGEGVAPSSEGARVEVTDGNVRVIDGPFAEAKELIAGFAILEVRSLAEAVEHARKFALLVGAERVDVRRVMECPTSSSPRPNSTATPSWKPTTSPTHWRRCGGSSHLAWSPAWSGSSVTSTPPRNSPRTRSWPPSRSGDETACRTTRRPG